MYGYNLSMSIDSTTISRPNAEQSETGIETLTTKEGGYTEQEFTVNKWGYKLTGDNYFPLETTIAPTTWISDEATKNNTHNITFAAKVDSSIKAGTYSTTLTFTAVANTPSPSALADYYALNGKSRKTITADINGDGTTEQVALYKMQDMTPTICSSADESEIQVIDDRDNKVYWILKAKDGKCWMTQNLDHNIDATKTYTSADTDVVNDWTPARSTIDISSGSLAGWVDSNNNPYSADPGNWYWTDTWYASAAYNYLVNGENSQFKKTAFTGNGTHGHVGNYYNWSAAVAMNDTSSYSASTVNDLGNSPQTSICPAGWRLPVSTTNYTAGEEGANEFYNLVYNYGDYRSDDHIITADPLYFVRSGYVYTSGLGYSGSLGRVWSNTVNNDQSVILFGFYSGSVDKLSAGRYYGFGVRCIARDGSEPVSVEKAFHDANKSTTTVSNKEYYKMQDMTSDICGAISEGQEAQLADSRDNKLYWILKAKDAHCWMTQNLDHNIDATKTYTSADTDIISDWTPARSTIDATSGIISGWGFDNNTPYSIDVGNWYWTDTWYYDSEYNYLADGENSQFKKTAFTGNGTHGHVGNYYNWSAAVASNNTSNSTVDGTNYNTSICPSGWRLPAIEPAKEFENLLTIYDAFPANGNYDKKMSASPLYFVRGGFTYNNGLHGAGESSFYQSSTIHNAGWAYTLGYLSSIINVHYADNNRSTGVTVRCLAR